MTLSLRKHVKPRVALALCALVSVCLGGCSSVQNQAPQTTATARAIGPEPALGRVVTITDPDQIVRPIDSYLPTVSETVELVAATRNATIACLSSHAKTASVTTLQSRWTVDEHQERVFVNGLARDQKVRSALWGFFDPQSASTSGFSRQGGDEFAAGYPTGVTGSAFNRCSKKAFAAFPGGASNQAIFTSTPNSLPGGGPTVPANDSRYVRAVKLWSMCMTNSGYSYPDPLTALNDARWHVVGATVSPAERAVAANDIRCKLSTNLVGIAVAVQSAYDRLYLDSHRPALDAYKKALAAYITKYN